MSAANCRRGVAGLPEMPGNGRLPLPLGWRGLWHRLVIHGGPFRSVPYGKFEGIEVFGVCVRAEDKPPHFDVRLPIEDFQVPRGAQYKEVVEAVQQALDAALSGKLVYVGCMGGWGRTGLFLAVVAKACGFRDPVGYVREHYSSHAVETREQRRYVDEFDVRPIRNWLFWAALRHRLG